MMPFTWDDLLRSAELREQHRRNRQTPTTESAATPPDERDRPDDAPTGGPDGP